MTISASDWKRYINRLSAINKKASDYMKAWIEANGTDDMYSLIEYAYSLTTHYGEAAAALACEMYDATALAEGASVLSAEPAAVALYDEVAKAMNGTSAMEKPHAISRLVKRTAADTTLMNAERDGAQFAWVPYGDTCAFCITLASRGWQYMSKKALKNGHAEHIHGNCDCQYAIRFDSKTSVDGYDPEALQREYYAAEGATPSEKINSMRRMKYSSIKDERNARRRAAYASSKTKRNEEIRQQEELILKYGNLAPL